MVGLVDIAPLTETVECNGVEIEVTGISVMNIAQLLGQFVELRKFWTTEELNVERLIELGPEVIAAIIAAGTGEANDDDIKRVVKRLPFSAVFELIEAIVRVTLPGGGLGPFMERAVGLTGGNLGALAQDGGEDGAGPSGKAPASKSPKPSKP
jgi:hypothetical protein